MITIRAETEEDIPAVHRVNELAFEQPAEAALVDRLRRAAHPLISLVAAENDQIVGHIFFSPVSIEPDNAAKSEAAASLIIGLAPMAVLPAYQNQGIGSRLVREGLEQCRRLEAAAIVVLGHPAYYPRFGFIPASRKNLRCEFPAPDEAFMALELTPDALAGQSGTVKYHPAFSAL